MTKKNITFIVVCSIVTAVLTALAIGVNLMVTVFAPTFSNVLGWGVGETEVIKAEGTENWDTDYYSPSFKSLEESAKNGARVTEEICSEGFVLLKNKNGALPLPSSTVIAPIGRGSVDAVYGGSGSGTVDLSRCITAVSGIKNAGFTVDENVTNFFANNYSNYDRCKIVMDNYDGSTFFIGEIPTSDYTFTPVSTQVAVVFITRGGGEGWDLSTDLKRDMNTSASQSAINNNANTSKEVKGYLDGQHQLELSAEEKGMIKFAKNNYAKTVVVINSSNIIEAGPLEDNGEYSADAILWVGGPGESGFNALGKILSGEVNPSGRTVDTWSRDFTKDPTFPNNGVFRYDGITEADVAKGNSSDVGAYFTQYEEGIYVGYRYYETASTEGYINYDEAVVYPFGHGLSYTEFSQKITDFNSFGDEIRITVEIENTGSVSGKSVAQVYCTPPYNKGGIEKSSVVLVGFAKTKTLGAGEKDTVTIVVPKEELASYDYKGIKARGGGYVLESGEYEISIRQNSHDVIEKRSFTQSGDIIYDENNARKSDEKSASNRFDDISEMFKDSPTTGYARNMSRADFAGTFPTPPSVENKDFDPTYVNFQTAQQNGGKTVKAGLAPFDVNTDPALGNVTTSKIYESVAPTVGGGTGLSLIDLRAKNFNDSAWSLLLDQLVKGDYDSATLNASAYNTAEIKSIGKPRTSDPDGPQGISSLFGKTGCCGYMSEVVTASTWNVEMARKMGVSVGEESFQYGSSGWYAPAANMHRNPFGGRNFEYYSEDGLLAGKMAQACIEGAAEKGVYAYFKHFSLNDTEVKRVDNNCIWANEQAIREIYLRPFEIALKRATVRDKYISDNQGTVAYVERRAGTAVMSSFNRIGTTWAGGHYGLMTEVLRGEWGFDGVAISDFNLYPYMNADQGMRAGTDMQLSFAGYCNFSDTESPTAMHAIRRAIHRMSYAVANSNKMQGAAPGSTFKYHLPAWQMWFIVLDVILYAGAVITLIVLVTKLLRDKRKSE